MNRKIVGVIAISVLVLSRSRAQDAKIVADNLEFSREFYSGVHFSVIAESQPSFGYQRYPNNGPERIQCDAGTFARQHGKPWLKSNDWGDSGRPADKQTARKLDAWVKLVEAVFNFVPSDVRLLEKSEESGRGRVQWVFEAHRANETGAPVRLTFAKPLYDKNPNVLLHAFEGSLPVASGKSGRSERVKFSFGYLISQGAYELSEALWENLETPKELESKSVNLSKFDMGPKPKDAESFVQRANARGFNGDVNGAIADFGRAIELDPTSVSAFYHRGIARLQKGDYDGAISDLNRAIELSPNTADYYNDRGLSKLRKEDNDGAIADFTRAIELDARNALAYRNRALARNIKKDADGALADYNSAIELDPKNANAFNSRGMIKKAKGDLDSAIADFTSAIGLNDKLAIAYKNRAEAKQAKGDAGAKEDFKRAGELDPQLASNEAVPNSSSNRPAAAGLPGPSSRGISAPNLRQADRCYESGLNKQRKGDLDGAMADYTRAIKFNPNYTEAYNNRGNIRGGKGDHDGAIADLSRAIQIDPKHTISYNNRGVQRLQKHDFDGAIADFNHAIELNPQYAKAYYNRGNVKEDKGDHDGAIADFDRAIEFNPKDPDSYNNRGNARKAKGDIDGAIADFTRAIELAPQDAHFYFSRGGAKFAARDFDGALADLDRVIQLNEKEPVPYEVRADIYAKKKQYPAAIKDIQKAIKLDPEDGDYYLPLARYQLFNRKPWEAIAACLKALTLSPDKAVVIKTKLADGYLFDNQFGKAKAIYLENKDAKLRDSQRTFSQVVLDDFKELEQAGVTHPDVAKIKALLAAKPE